MPRRRSIGIVLPLFLLAGCTGDDVQVPTLTGRAVLPADTFAPGPPTGAALTGEINGRTPPFASVPVQGFSSLVRRDDGTVVVLQDNGFGNRFNSPDVPLRIYTLELDLDGGRVRLLETVSLTDPGGHLDFTLQADGAARPLTGGDLDPESFVRLADGTYWIGEEFGPFLLHVDAEGAVLASPASVPVPAALRAHARGQEVLRSPDHPDLRSLNEDLALASANLPRSGGVEGLALAPDGRHLYLAVEKPLFDDPRRDRRLILEFDTAAAAFTGRWWSWSMDAPELSIASLECTPGGALLLTERDEEEGAEARVKRIHVARPDAAGAGGDLAKTLVVDLLEIADPDGATTSAHGTIGLGPRFAFPFVTPECLAVLDGRTLLVANDNNYPMSNGRRRGEPDANEFIRLRLPEDLD